MNKILYVHYQRSARDGSHVHTSEFSKAFGEICEQRGMEFSVVAPALEFDPPPAKTSALARFKQWLARFYLRDIRLLLEQRRAVAGQRQMLERERPDVVLMRYDGRNVSLIWACQQLNIPIVLEINAPAQEETAGYLHLPGVVKYFGNKNLLKLANGAFAVSNELAQEMAVPGKPLRTIPNGVSLERFDPAAISGAPVRERLGVGADKVVIGFVGSFAPWHGAEALIDGFARLRASNPQAHLLLVGQVRPEAEPLMQRLEAPELQGSVTRAGFVPSQEIADYIAAMDITLLPNSAYYCSPLKIFEYMAMETAVVSVGTGPMRAMLVDGEEGLLFEPGDYDAMVAAINRLAADAELRQRLGRNARARMAAEFTWRHNAQHIYELLDTVTQGHQG